MEILFFSPQEALVPNFKKQLYRSFGEEFSLIHHKGFHEVEKSSFLKAELIISETKVEGVSAFDFFEKYEITKPLVFIGQDPTFLKEGLKFLTLDLISDPFHENSLENALKKFGWISGRDSRRSVQKSYKKRFLTKLGNRMTFVPAENVACFFSDQGITFLMESKTSQKFLVEHTLNELECQLLDPDKFYRINRSIIVNLDNLVEMKPFQNGRLALSLKAKTEETLIVAREKVNEFKSWIDR